MSIGVSANEFVIQVHFVVCRYAFEEDVDDIPTANVNQTFNQENTREDSDSSDQDFSEEDEEEDEEEDTREELEEEEAAESQPDADEEEENVEDYNEFNPNIQELAQLLSQSQLVNDSQPEPAAGGEGGDGSETLVLYDENEGEV